MIQVVDVRLPFDADGLRVPGRLEVGVGLADEPLRQVPDVVLDLVPLDGGQCRSNPDNFTSMVTTTNEVTRTNALVLLIRKSAGVAGMRDVCWQ